MFTDREKQILITALHATGVDVPVAERSALVLKIGGQQDSLQSVLAELEQSERELQETKIEALTDVLEVILESYETTGHILGHVTALLDTLSESGFVPDDIETKVKDLTDSTRTALVTVAPITDKSRKLIAITRGT